MENETRKILKIIEEDNGYYCGYCKACKRIEKRLDALVNKLKTKPNKVRR